MMIVSIHSCHVHFEKSANSFRGEISSKSADSKEHVFSRPLLYGVAVRTNPYDTCTAFSGSIEENRHGWGGRV